MAGRRSRPRRSPGSSPGRRATASPTRSSRPRPRRTPESRRTASRPTRILAATLGAPAAARAVVASTSAAIEARRNTATPSTEKYEHAADYCEIAGLARSRRSADSSAAPAAPILRGGVSELLLEREQGCAEARAGRLHPGAAALRQLEEVGAAVAGFGRRWTCPDSVRRRIQVERVVGAIPSRAAKLRRRHWPERPDHALDGELVRRDAGRAELAREQLVRERAVDELPQEHVRVARRLTVDPNVGPRPRPPRVGGPRARR